MYLNMSLQYVTVEYLFDPTSASRCGVIPYAPSTDTRPEMWLLGTLPSGRLSDFGGSCLPGSIPIECLIQHVELETNGLLVDPIADSIDAAMAKFESGDDSPTGLHSWKWINQRRSDDFSYLLFVPVDYTSLESIGSSFQGNEDATKIQWYSKDYLIQTTRVSGYNTSIQKFLRRFGFSS